MNVSHIKDVENICIATIVSVPESNRRTRRSIF